MVGTKTRGKIKSVLFLSAISSIFLVGGIVILREMSKHV
jgi:uncharacterized protein involved in exopolysaccharide biosynthesis